jgi:putative transposase
VRIFPNAQSCLRLIRLLAVETHENRLEQHCYLNMEELREHKKLMTRQAAGLIRCGRVAELSARVI